MNKTILTAMLAWAACSMRAEAIILGPDFDQASKGDDSVVQLAPVSVPNARRGEGGQPNLPGKVRADLSDELNPFNGLKQGARDAGLAGPVWRVQRVLRVWGKKLPLELNGVYDDETMKALLLYKAVYGTGKDGGSVDALTARYLLAMESGAFWKDPPKKSPGGELLYAAMQDLGVPYRLGGDGTVTTDCARFTEKAMLAAARVVFGAPLVDALSRIPSLRTADFQWKWAKFGATLGLPAYLHVREKDQQAAGDLVFFKETYHPKEDYWWTTICDHVTHVGIYIDNGYMIAAHRPTVSIQKISDNFRPDKIVGYAYVAQPGPKGQ